jgi:hypothetical protein
LDGVATPVAARSRSACCNIAFQFCGRERMRCRRRLHDQHCRPQRAVRPPQVDKRVYIVYRCVHPQSGVTV